MWQLEGHTLPREERKVGLVGGGLTIHQVDVLPVDPEARAQTAVDYALDFGDVAAGLRLLIFKLVVVLSDLFLVVEAFLV